MNKEIPTGNYHQDFFVDVIIAYAAFCISDEDRQQISTIVSNVLTKGRKLKNSIIDFSGTHSQPDNPNYCVEG